MDSVKLLTKLEAGPRLCARLADIHYFLGFCFLFLVTTLTTLAAFLFNHAIISGVALSPIIKSSSPDLLSVT